MSEPTALDSAASRRPAVIVYFLCCALVVALLPLNGRIRWSEVGPALVLQALAGAVLAAGSRLPSDRYPAVGVVAVIAYLSSVALLRDGVDAASGFGTLVLLPVVWASLRARRIELTIAVAGVALIHIAPVLLIGPPKYPAGTWRAGLLFTVISVGLGAGVLNLTGRVHALVGQLAELARTDELTGIPNRRAWQELLDHELSIFRRNGRPFAIVMLDLDHFKSYNDTHGHPAGDRLLREMAAAWGSALREPDVLARWGGDEFVVLLPACDASRSAGVLERLRTACPEAPFSAGLAQSEPGSTAESMLAAADAALYTSKRAGRPDVSFVPAAA